MKEKRKIFKTKKSIIMTVVLMILVVASTTLAWFIWSSQDNTNMDLTIGQLADINVVGGNNINISNLSPVFNYTDGTYTQIIVKKRTETDVFINATLNISSLSTELKTSTFKWKIVSSTDGITYNTVVEEGTFENAVVGNNQLLEDVLVSLGTTYYRIYYYIDGNVENNINMQGKSLTGTLDFVVEPS